MPAIGPIDRAGLPYKESDIMLNWAAIYSGTWELGTPKGLRKAVLNSELVLFLWSNSMYWIGLGTEVAVLNSQVVPISQVVLRQVSLYVSFASNHPSGNQHGITRLCRLAKQYRHAHTDFTYNMYKAMLPKMLHVSSLMLPRGCLPHVGWLKPMQD